MEENKSTESNKNGIFSVEDGGDEKKKSEKEIEIETMQKVTGYGKENSVYCDEAKNITTMDEVIEVTDIRVDVTVGNEEKGGGVGDKDAIVAGSDCHYVDVQGWKHAGWKKRVLSGSNRESTNFYYISPTGEEIYSLNEVKSYCKTNNLTVNYDKFTFTSEDSEEKMSRLSNSSSTLLSVNNSNSAISSDAKLNGLKNCECSVSGTSVVSEKKQTTTSAFLRAYTQWESLRSVNRQNSISYNQAVEDSTTTSLSSKAAHQNDGKIQSGITCEYSVCVCACVYIYIYICIRNLYI